ncbi:MAG: putative Zn-dependent protease [Lentisphaeria bacterium]|jgi:predicted Zn-dependent protease
MHPLRILSLVLPLIVFAGCAVNPVTGKKEFSLVPASQEIAIGTQNYLPYQQQQGGRYIVDPELSLYVNGVGQKLAAVSDRSKLPFEFTVLNNDVPNAWALPGGKIAVNRGLLLLLDDEAQLAAVLSHEIVHAAAKHGANQMTQSILLGLGTQVATVASRNTDYGDLVALGANTSAGLWSARYGRDQELESDAYGIEYMVRAGYDPQAAVELQQTFVKLSGSKQSSWMNTLFASHPPSQERVDKNKALVQSTPAGGVRNRARYLKAIGQIIKDNPAYQQHQQALKAASDNNTSQALSLLDSAIKKQPDEALFYATKGQMLLAAKKEADATQAFAKAAQKNPEYYVGFLGLGLIQKKQNKTAQAKANLLKSTQFLPTQIAVYHLGEIELTQGNKDAAVQYFSAAASQGGELAQKAQSQLAILQPSTPAQ